MITSAGGSAGGTPGGEDTDDSDDGSNGESDDDSDDVVILSQRKSVMVDCSSEEDDQVLSQRGFSQADSIPLDSDDSDVDEQGPGAKARARAAKKAGKRRQRVAECKRQQREVKHHIRPPTQEVAARIVFETGENATQLLNKTVVNLTVRACAEYQRKDITCTTNVSTSRWVKMSDKSVVATLPDAADPAEYKRIFGFSRADKVSYVCCDPKCSYHEEFRFRKANDAFVCFACSPHTCGDVDHLGKGRFEARHALDAQDLAPILATLAAAQTEKVKPELMRSYLYPAYLATQPTDTFCRRVFSFAIAAGKAKGETLADEEPSTDSDNVGKLKHCMAVLQSLGYETQLLSATRAQQEEIILMLAREEHQRCEENKPSHERSAFRMSEKVQELLEQLREAPADARFYRAMMLVFPWAKHFLQMGAQWKVVVVSGADAGHCTGPCGGTLYILVMCDANRQTVILGWAHFAENEADAPWNLFMAFVKAVLPEFDASNIVMYRDGRSSITKCLNNHARNVFRFNCVRHAAEAAAHNVRGGGIAKDYTKMASACSISLLAGYKQMANPDLIRYINESPIPEQQRFLATFQAAGGKTQATLSNTNDHNHVANVEARTTSQFVEVNMASAKADGSRNMAPMEMLLQTVITWTRRMMAHKAAADGCTGTVPPQVQKMLDNLWAKASQPGGSSVVQQPGGVLAVVRPNLFVSNARFTCDIAARTCGCGLTALTDFPCLCMTCFAKAKGVPLASLVQVADTTTYWKMQYDFDFAQCMPSEANIYNGPSDDLLMPLVLPKPAGRPRTSRRKSALERAAGRRPPGAEGKQPRKIYICKKCGQPKKGHTCKGRL